jgi:hypothetical protein
LTGRKSQCLLETSKAAQAMPLTSLSCPFTRHSALLAC